MSGSSRRTLAFMGGTFDPPHIGHLLLARDVIESTGVEQLHFVPAARNPHKESGPVASGADRLAMLQLATSADGQLGVLDLELQRSGPSYTCDTVLALRDRFPDADLAWVIGADQLPALPRWHAIDELVAAVEFFVLARPGYVLEAPLISGLRWRAVASRQLEISATEIRACRKAGKPIDFFVPENVLNYIHRHQLYTR